MADPEWLTQAKTLPEGRSRKILCCGNSPSMLVSHKREGYHAWCFRCQEPGLWRSHEHRGLKELLAIRAAREEIAQQSSNTGELHLPKDFQDARHIPSSSMTWLWSAGITRDTAAKYGIGWSNRLQRVVLPVYDHRGRLLYYQGRHVTPKNSPKSTLPKYLNISTRNFSGVFSSLNPKCSKERSRLQRCFANKHLPTVIVEDILSAVRVGRQFPTIALLGTSVSPGALNALTALSQEAGCITWTDNDAAGQKANRSLKSTIALLGLDVGSIRTERDPKTYSNQEIKEFIMKAHKEMTC